MQLGLTKGMAEEVEIKETSIDEVVEVNKTIVEFDPHSRRYFEDRYRGKVTLITVAYVDGQPAGYLVGYDRFDDGSFYCWMVGVNPVFRKRGVLKALMNYQETWVRKRGYTKIRIKTRNSLREMLAYLVKYGFYLVEVIQYPSIEDNRILLEKNV